MEMHNKDNGVGLETEATQDNARLLELCAAQIAAAVDEAYREIDGLAAAIVSTAKQVTSLPAEGDTVSVDATAEYDNSASSKALGHSLNKIVMRLQFANRLRQRLSNVQTNLLRMAEFTRGNSMPAEEGLWSNLLEQTRATFTMEQERQMFDTLFGAGPATSSDPVLNSSASAQPEGLILFDDEVKDD